METLAAGLNWRSVSRRRYIVVVSDAAAYPEREQSALPTALSFSSVEGQTVSAVWVLDPRTNLERFMRALAAAGNGSFIDATHGETMLASRLLAILKSWARARARLKAVEVQVQRARHSHCVVNALPWKSRIALTAAQRRSVRDSLRHARGPRHRGLHRYPLPALLRIMPAARAADSPSTAKTGRYER